MADIEGLLRGASRRLAAVFNPGGARSPTSDLAHPVELSVAWEDLGIPEWVRRRLADIAASMAGRGQIYPSCETQATQRPSRRVWVEPSAGIDSLAVAQAFAASLKVQLYRVDLSSVVSKYIGETEKSLRSVFDSAEDAGALLLFDEADALFDRGSGVRESNYRYAQGRILKAIADYKGAAIFVGRACDEIDRRLCDLMDDFLDLRADAPRVDPPGNDSEPGL